MIRATCDGCKAADPRFNRDVTTAAVAIVDGLHLCSHCLTEYHAWQDQQDRDERANTEDDGNDVHDGGRKSDACGGL